MRMSKMRCNYLRLNNKKKIHNCKIRYIVNQNYKHMRTLEIILIVSLAIYFIGNFLKKRNKPAWLNWMPYFAIVICILHILIEGIRWQMFIVYTFTGLLFIMLIWQNFINRKVNKNT